MPTAKPNLGIFDNLKEAMDPDGPLRNSKASDAKDAARVRETFLGYRGQLEKILSIIKKSDGKGEAALEEMETEAKAMLVVLDTLDKRKRITADTLLNFVSQLHKMGERVDQFKAKAEETGQDNEFNRHKNELEGKSSIRKRLDMLRAELGKDLNEVIVRNADKISQVGSTPLKLALSSILGPGAPLVSMLDDLIDLNKVTRKTAGLAVTTAKETLKAAKATAVAAMHPVRTLKAMKTKVDGLVEGYSALKERNRVRVNDFQKKVLAAIAGVRKGVNRLTGGLGSVISGALTSIAGFFGNMFGRIMSFLGPILGKLGIPMPGKLPVKALASAALLYSGLETIDRNQDKSFTDGGLDSRASGYVQSASAGALALSGLGPPGAAAGAVVGTGIAAYKDPNNKARVNYEQNKKHLVDASTLTGVDPSLLGTMAHMESKFDATARPVDSNGKLLSSATGLFQITDDTWKDLMKRYGGQFGIAPGTKATDPRANAILGAMYAKDNQAFLQSNGIKADKYSTYAAHFLGPAGAKNLFESMSSNPNGSAALAMPQAAKANQSVFYHEGGGARTNQEVFKELVRRVDSSSRWGTDLAADAKIMTEDIPTRKYVPTRRGGMNGVPYVAGSEKPANGQGATATQSSLTVDTVPFMPDDNSLMSLNIAGLIGG